MSITDERLAKILKRIEDNPDDSWLSSVTKDCLDEIQRLKAEIKCDEQRVADLMDGIGRLCRERDALKTDLCASDNAAQEWRIVAEGLEQKLRNERNTYKDYMEIVSKIWVMLGNPTYEELKGRSIYDLIAELKAELASTQRECVIVETQNERFVEKLEKLEAELDRYRNAVSEDVEEALRQFGECSQNVGLTFNNPFDYSRETSAQSKSLDRLKTLIGSLIARNEEERRDSERLDYLENNPGFELDKYITWLNKKDEYTGTERFFWRIKTKDDDEFEADTLRDAIDAAINQSKQEGNDE